MNRSLTCDYCNKNFEVVNSIWKSRRSKKKKLNCNIYCSLECRTLSRGFSLQKTVFCKNCNKEFNKHSCDIKKTLNNFCTKSCAAIYNNTHKRIGTRRSKLESWLELELTKLFPNLEILYSDKTTINSELDIYIPSLKLAFELNGIFHYEPIFGKDKLQQIQNNDNRKFQACLEKEIELCIIDTSGQKYFKEQSSIKYLNIITNLVTSKLEASKTDCVEVL